MSPWEAPLVGWARKGRWARGTPIECHPGIDQRGTDTTRFRFFSFQCCTGTEHGRGVLPRGTR